MVNINEFIKTNPYEKDVTIDFNDDKDLDISIIDIFKDCNPIETSSAHKMECPDCGLQGGRTKGFILFSDSNSAFCQSSGKHFRFLEAYALKKKIIKCLDGRETGSDSNTKILGGELFTMTLEEFRNEFGTDMYNRLSDQLHIKARIKLPGNNHYISTFADKLGEVYKSRNVLFYRGESKEVVEIGRYKKITKDGEEYVETGFSMVDGGRLVSLIEMFVKPFYEKTEKDEEVEVEKSMNQMTGSLVLKSPNFQNKIPSINRIFEIPIPIIHKKELTFPKTGYDERFGSWLPTNSPEIIKKDMTLEDAKELIATVFEEFCFDKDKDKTHAIAGFITPFLHGLLPKFSTRTPVFIYMANRERAGKDYCAGCTGILYEGAKTEEPAICNDESGSNNEELRKKITACMRQGKKRFHSANNKGLLNNSILEGVTTSELWDDRILGKSEVILFNNEMDFSLSGNMGIRLTPDMSNRSRIVNLHLVDEDANARIFKNPNLHEWIMDNREILLSAVYTLVRNWVEKGMPDGTVPFSSFSHWAKVCGGIMDAAEYDNPCKTDKSTIISLDTETEEMKILFETAYNLYPNKWLTKKEIQEIVENDNLMDYMDFNEQADKVKFALKIDKFSRRMLSDVFMEVDSIEKRANRRKYKFTKDINIKIDNDKKSSIGNDTSEQKNTKFEEHDKTIKELVKSPEKVVGLVGFGRVALPANFSKKIINNIGNGDTLPSLPTLPLSDNPSNNLEKVPLETEVKVRPKGLAKFSDMAKEIHAKRIEKNKPIEKKKTDRELQFFESPECESIIEQCTKDQVYKWIKLNPNISYKKMYNKLGFGCLKYVIDLTKEKKIKSIGNNWEVINERFEIKT